MHTWPAALKTGAQVYFQGPQSYLTMEGCLHEAHACATKWVNELRIDLCAIGVALVPIERMLAR